MEEKKSLSKIYVWALAFGSIIGWGAFVMPASSFLPSAGPLGTTIAVIIAAGIMILIAYNFQYMMNRHPKNGGPLVYTARTFGYEHGFFCAWFLGLAYICLIPQNATAVTLICRMLLGDTFQVWHLYDFAGYEIYFGEIAVSTGLIAAVGVLCYFGRRLVGIVQTVLAVILFAGVVTIGIAAIVSDNATIANMTPSFSGADRSKILEIISVLAVMPWAFVGFDTISLSVERFRFPVKKSLCMMIIAILMGGGVYIITTVITASSVPAGYDSWLTYLADTGNISGLRQIPLFQSAHNVMGDLGVWILVAAAFSAVFTGLIGFYVASTRLLTTMAGKDLLPRWFRRTEESGSLHVIVFIAIVSVTGPFFGRNGLGWLVDISSLGAAIGFGYTSLAAFRVAREEGSRRAQVTGMIGALLSVGFGLLLLVPYSMEDAVLEPESYLLLGIWGTLGFILYWVMLRRNDVRAKRKHVLLLGAVLLIVILFSTTVWMLQTIHRKVVEVTGIQGISAEEIRRAIHGTVVSRIIIYSVLVGITIIVMFAIYYRIHKQNEGLEEEKMRAEEGNRLKTEFLSNMSHDIRTPMNAIIGYTDLARESLGDVEKTREYLNKIYFSGRHLLELINDVLEMSRIESGRIDLDEDFYDVRAIMDHLDSMIRGQAEEKNISLTFETKNIRHNIIFCDRLRLNQIFLNLIGNSIKFTPEGGEIHVSVEEFEDIDELHANYEIRVRDNGIGMDEEFARHVFEPFERERTSTVSGVQGTGLGMAITKNLVELMHGMIDLVTRPGQGTEFIIHIPFRRKSMAATDEDGTAIDSRHIEAVDTTPDEKKWDFTGKRALLVDDNMINREIAKAILDRFGFSVDEATDGDEAVAAVENAADDYFDVVLMDIQMPRMNGHDATRAIRSMDNAVKSRIPIIAMTANAFEEDVKRAHDAGMDAHVAKPIDIPELMKTLAEVFGMEAEVQEVANK
ncbi:MAG: amino acid permease [Eubacterium sp.]|nr:amino acid permease [Eubacterium sp.]